MPFKPPPEPTLVTAQAVTVYMDQVSGEIADLNTAVIAQVSNPRLTQEMIDGWNRFKALWLQFRDNYLDWGHYFTVPSTAWRETAQYQAKNEAWRAIFAGIGIGSVAPPPQDIPESRAFKDIEGLLVTAGLIGGALWLLWEFK